MGVSMVDGGGDAARIPYSPALLRSDGSPYPRTAPETAAAQPVTPVAAPAPRPASSSPEEVRAHALLAQDVYGDLANPPAGYRVASPDDLTQLGLDESLLDVGDFRARVYVSGSGADAQYVIAMRGSRLDDLGDWQSNAQQAFGFNSEHYRAALAIGERIARSPMADQVEFTGHSLGGGLASAAAVASGRPADTFNAAGLHDNTLAAADAIREQTDARGRPVIDAWHVEGEALGLIQNGGDRVFAALIFGAAAGAPGAIGGAALVDVPEAYGTRHDLAPVDPDGSSHWWDNLNPPQPIYRHSIEWVLSSLPR